MTHPNPSVVLADRDGPILTLALSRPDRLNAVSLVLYERLIAHLEEADADASVRCVIVTGKGRAFCAGGAGWGGITDTDSVPRGHPLTDPRDRGTVLYMENSTISRLAGLADIRMGYALRRRLEPATGPNTVAAVQLKDVAADVPIALERLARFRRPRARPHHYVGVGDVLFRSRGGRYTAAVLDSLMAEAVLAVAPLIVLRPDPEIVLPQYLAWAINQPSAQRHFARVALGTAMSMVSRAALADLAIAVPSIATQRRIGTIAGLADREFALATKAANKRRMVVRRVLAEQADLHCPVDRTRTAETVRPKPAPVPSNSTAP